MQRFRLKTHRRMGMQLQLIRTEVSPDGTFGWLYAGGLQFATCEDDWKDNAPNESCIPAGTYKIHRTVYVKHGYETFEIAGVPNRTRILIHPGNSEEDTQGCILVGMRQGFVVVPVDEDTGAVNVKKRSVVASQEAFRRFMRALEGVDAATLEVSWGSGVGP